MKPFNLEEAKAGKPVCTRDGRPVRILCFDKKSNDDDCIVCAVLESDNTETIYSMFSHGKWFKDSPDENSNDLMMAPKKHERYINVYRSSVSGGRTPGAFMFNTKKQAINAGKASPTYITTTKIEWEE